jgi:uncharacterized membrane protein
MQAINDRREVVGSGDFGTYLWRSGTLTELATLAGAGAAAVDINDRGTIAGYSASTPDGLNAHAVIWTR